jgi:hypothetical protein
LERVPEFSNLETRLRKSFAINGKASSTLNNYLRCLSHLALHSNLSPEVLDIEEINEYLFHCQNLQKTPSESFFKYTIFGLRAACKVMGMDQKRIKLPQSLYDKLFKKAWVVYAKPPFGEPENVIEYLGRYTHKIAISNSRILAIDKQTRKVTFSLKNYKKGGEKTTLTLYVKEFIRRFQLHVLPKGFTRIRHYGCLSSSWKKDKLPLLQLQLADKDLEYTQTFIAQEKSLHRICSSCKKETLITILTFDSRGPPKNHEQIIKHRLLKFNP